MNQSTHNWNERYITGNTPWSEHGLLTPVLESIQALLPQGKSILEIGCGYGQEAIALAKQGYIVSAVDLSSAAITQAQLNAQTENVAIHFETYDVLHEQNQFTPFDLILDIAVLHTIQNEQTRHKFAKAVASLLKPQALWINLSCLSPDVLHVTEATGVQPPPALSRLELQQLNQQHFIIKAQQDATYRITRDGKAADFPALISVLQKCG